MGEKLVLSIFFPIFYLHKQQLCFDHKPLISRLLCGLIPICGFSEIKSTQDKLI